MLVYIWMLNVRGIRIGTILYTFEISCNDLILGLSISEFVSFVSDEEIFVSLWHDLTAGLIYEMVTASQLSITLNIKNKCI